MSKLTGASDFHKYTNTSNESTIQEGKTLLSSERPSSVEDGPYGNKRLCRGLQESESNDRGVSAQEFVAESGKLGGYQVAEREELDRKEAKLDRNDNIQRRLDELERLGKAMSEMHARLELLILDLEIQWRKQSPTDRPANEQQLLDVLIRGVEFSVDSIKAFVKEARRDTEAGDFNSSQLQHLIQYEDFLSKRVVGFKRAREQWILSKAQTT